MQRIQEVLAKSRAAQAQATETVTASPQMNRMRELSKLIKENRVPRYLLYGVIMLKTVSVYDKMKQLVAINQMQAAIITSKSTALRRHFDSEEELQDLMTKRMLESQMINDDEADLGEDSAESASGLQGSAMTNYAARAKTKQLK